MNRLSNERRAQVLTLLTEGTGINSVVRITGIAKTTVLWLPAEAGRFCSAYQAYRLRGLRCSRIEADEIWSLVGTKQKNACQPDQGDLWGYTALDPDSKLMVAWAVGAREPATSHAVMAQLAARVGGRIQLTTDGQHHVPGRRAGGLRLTHRLCPADQGVRPGRTAPHPPLRSRTRRG